MKKIDPFFSHFTLQAGASHLIFLCRLNKYDNIGSLILRASDLKVNYTTVSKLETGTS